jgi:hypothetical protein
MDFHPRGQQFVLRSSKRNFALIEELRGGITMNAKIVAILIVFLLPFHAIAASLWGSLQPGDYSVGFEIINKIDYSRPYKSKFSYEGTFYSGERGRPLQISVWYPAEKTQGARPLNFEDYISLTASEETLKDATAQEKQEAVTRFLKSQWSQGSDEAKLRSSLQNPLAAIKNAPKAGGSFL